MGADEDRLDISVYLDKFVVNECLQDVVSKLFLQTGKVSKDPQIYSEIQ